MTQKGERWTEEDIAWFALWLNKGGGELYFPVAVTNNGHFDEMSGYGRNGESLQESLIIYAKENGLDYE